MFVSVVAVGLCLLFSLFIWWIRKSNVEDQETLPGLPANNRLFGMVSRDSGPTERDLMIERLDQVLARPGEPPIFSMKAAQTNMEVAPLLGVVSEPNPWAPAADSESVFHEVMSEPVPLVTHVVSESALHEEVVSEPLLLATTADSELALHEVVSEPSPLGSAADSESVVHEVVSEPLPLATTADSELALHEVVSEPSPLASAADSESALHEAESEQLLLASAANNESAAHEVVSEPLFLATVADSESAFHEVVSEPPPPASAPDNESVVLEVASEPVPLVTAADNESVVHEEVASEPLSLAAVADSESVFHEVVSEPLLLATAADSESALHEEIVSEPLPFAAAANNESTLHEVVSEALRLASAAGSESPFHEIVNESLPLATAADSESVAEAIHEFALKIDPRTLHAIEVSTTHELHEIADLHTYVQDHFFATPVENNEGWFSRLGGYVAGQRGATISEQMNWESWREVSLLIEEQAIVDRVLVDARADVVGEGGGAAFGGRVDAIVRGTGTKIGGVLGSIAGGTMNKTASTESRRAPLHVARDKYNTMITCAQSAIYADIESSKQEVLWLQTECQSRFSDFLSSAETEAKEKIGSFDREFESKLLECYLRLPEFLDDFSQQLKDKEVAAFSQMARVNFWQVVIRPLDFRKRMAIWFGFRRAQAKIAKDVQSFNKIEPKTPATLHPAVQKILKDSMIDHRELKQELEAISVLQNDLEKAAGDVRSQAIEQVDSDRQRLIEEFIAQVSNLRDEIAATVERWNNKVAAAREELRRQATAVGISV